MKSRLIRILIADDHAIVREGVKQILADTTADMVVAGEAVDGPEALQAVRAMNWDVLLLDISMPGSNGLDVLQQVMKERPDLPVIMLTMYPEAAYAMRALRAGASGYVTKNSATKELVSAIRTVIAGGQYVSAGIAEKLAFELRGAPASAAANAEKLPHESLSDRELQVLCRLAKGMTNAEIAREQLLSVHTISASRARVMAKMHFKNNAALIRYAVEKGLVE